MIWRRWKIGVAVAIFLSLLVAGAGLASGASWITFLSVFCAACATHFGSFIKDHPVDSIVFDDPPDVEDEADESDPTDPRNIL